MADATPPRVNHLRYIDALRGWAFLGVVVTHCAPKVPAFHLSRVAEAGGYGVQLFFLISAVTLFRSMSVRDRQERNPTLNFFIRRFFRIAPLFYFGIVLYAFLLGSGPTKWAPRGLGFWQYFTTATFTQGWVPTTFTSVVPGGWSIAVETTFYLCLPWMFPRVSSFASALTATFVSLVAGIGLTRLVGHFMYPYMNEEYYTVDFFFLSRWFPTQLCVFLLGATLHHVLRDGRVRSYLAAHRSLPVVLVAVGLYFLFALTGMGEDFWLPGSFRYALAFCPLVLGLSARPLAALVNPLTCALGTLSYSGYLMHFAALLLVEGRLAGGWLLRLPHGGPELYFALYVLCVLAATVVFSTATHWLIERPGIALGKRLIERGEARRTAPAALTAVGLPD